MHAPSAAPAALSGRARWAWIALLAISALLVVNHAIVAVAVDDGDTPLVVAMAVINALAVVLLLGPYRRLRPWAWLLLWVEVLALASVIGWGDDLPLRIAYGVIALVLAALQLVTPRAFPA